MFIPIVLLGKQSSSSVEFFVKEALRNKIILFSVQHSQMRVEYIVHMISDVCFEVYNIYYHR